MLFIFEQDFDFGNSMATVFHMSICLGGAIDVYRWLIFSDLTNSKGN